jgi:hypothetical protein
MSDKVDAAASQKNIVALLFSFLARRSSGLVTFDHQHCS